MAEQVNQRLEESINELEQMKRIGLYSDEDINAISRQRKRLEYLIQRHEKKKEDFLAYITYELTLLRDITEKRKQLKMNEKKKDIEYAIASRVNRIFKQFIHRFHDTVLVYFEYFRYCKSVGFDAAASGMIGEMLQMHGDKAVTWQFASKWEMEERNNIEGAREFLIKGLQRHPEAEILYVELFRLELIQLVFKTEDEEEKTKLLNRADVVWRNGVKKLKQIQNFLIECLELLFKYEVQTDMVDKIKSVLLWGLRAHKEVLPYIAQKELEGCHFKESEDFANTKFPEPISYCIGAFEEALKMRPEEQLFTKFIHTLLGMSESVCNEIQKIAAVKHAWWTGYKGDLLTERMFEFGINILKLEGKTSNEDLLKILNEATKKQKKHKSFWAEKLSLAQPDENKQLDILQEGARFMTAEDSIFLYNEMIFNIQNPETLTILIKKIRFCENTILLAVKPKILQKMYTLNGLTAARGLYNELIKIPPMQIEIHKAMIKMETEQPKPNAKEIRRCYEFAIVFHGADNVELWDEYIDFETIIGNNANVHSVHRRAMVTLQQPLRTTFSTLRYKKSVTGYASQKM